MKETLRLSVTGGLACKYWGACRAITITQGEKSEVKPELIQFCSWCIPPSSLSRIPGINYTTETCKEHSAMLRKRGIAILIARGYLPNGFSQNGKVNEGTTIVSFENGSSSNSVDFRDI